ncbi:MAG TPA: hypothetical protein VJU15_02205 [Gemmatimonadales bacterium]|nr:hypothetical protein [Gemmatimonadales bacterium]
MRHRWTIALSLALALPTLNQAEQPAARARSETRVSTVMLTIKLDSDIKLPSNFSPSSIKVKVGNEERMLDDNDKDGTWQAVFDYLLPGLYPVTLGLPDGVRVETDPALPIEIEVEAGKDINKDITLKSVTTIIP